MRDGNIPSSEGEDGADRELDEFLCEYVDGTMDRVVREAFEEYLRQDPSLYEHVACLRRTRSVLCRYGCRVRAPEKLQERIHQRLGEETLAVPPVMPQVANRLNVVATLSSVLLLVCGFFIAGESESMSTDTPAPRSVATEMRVDPAPLPSAAAMTTLMPAVALTQVPLVSRRGAARPLPLRHATSSDSLRAPRYTPAIASASAEFALIP